MLHASAGHAFDVLEVETLIFQSLKNHVDRIEPHGNWCEDLALGFVGEHALFDAIFAEVCVKVGLCFEVFLEVAINDDCYRRCQ